MKKIAMIYICTGNYDVFWNDFYTSSEKNFLPDCKKHYFIFTDSKKIISNESITIIEKEKLEWPFSAFSKFDYILSIKKVLKNFDYIFLINANTIIKKTILINNLFPSKQYKLVGVKHIGFIYNKKETFPYERNKKSKAFIDYNDGYNYFFSATSGGLIDEYLKLCETCKNWFEEDYTNNIIPIWHDESYINKYFYENNDILMKLSPKYGYPELTFIRFKNSSIIYSSKERFGGYKYLRNLNYKYKKIDKIKFLLNFYILYFIYGFGKLIRLREILFFFNILK